MCSNLAVAALLAALLAVTGCPRPADRFARQLPVRIECIPVIRVRVATAPDLAMATSGPYRLLVDGRIVAAAGDPLPATRLQRRDDGFALRREFYPGTTLTVEPIDRGRVRLGEIAYRGAVSFTADSDAGMIAVNHVDVESYLAGVLPRELYPGWDDTTYRVQAIAARTYALYEKTACGANGPYDLRNDQSSQVYGGFTAETDRAWRAVRGTHGIVLATGARGQERLFRAHYSSCCGGRTNPVHVLYGPPVTAGPLAGGVICDDCKASSRYSWPPVTVPKDVIHKALGRVYPQAAAMESVTAVRVVSECNGRGVWLDVIGPGGKKVRVRADDLRLALLRYPEGPRGLYSMNCRIRDAGDSVVFEWGRGFGHAVGLCQWGARGKALRGESVEQILATYYPTSRLFRAYD